MRPLPTARRAIQLGIRLAVVAMCASCTPMLVGQATTPAIVPPRTGESALSAGVEFAEQGVIEQQPRILYAPDADGHPVPLINVPLAKIQELLNQRDGLDTARRPPAFQFNRLTVRGTPREHLVQLDVELEVTILTPIDGEAATWTALPLRFHDASLLAPPTYEGDGQLHVAFDPEAGYEGWLLHDRPGDHRIKLKLAVPLAKAAESTQLRFYPPLANRSELELQLTEKEVTADVENARNMSVRASETGPTVLHADDLRNQVIVTWRAGGPTGREPPTYLDVRGDIRITIDGPGAIRSNAALDLQSYGRPIEQFSLRLPPNTKIVSGNQPGYTVSQLTSDDQDTDDGRTTVQIKLEKPAPQARVQLVAQTTDRAEAMSTVNVASFEVIGAIRQSGRVSLLTSDEWLVYWTLGPSVRRVQTLESYVDTSQERNHLASFQYFRQPCTLDVQIQPQGTRVDVTPAYRMRVSEDRISLEAQLKCQIRGARVSFVNFSLNGWQLDDVGPSGAVENDDFSSSGSDPIKLRLTQATTGDLALTLNLHRPVATTQGTLRIPLPWPGADAITPGHLIISAADSVVLNYRLQEMTGLVQDPLLAASVTPPDPVDTATAPPMAFRFMADRELGEVVMDYEVRAQEIRARLDTVMELSADAAQVSQRIAYRILYEPASRLQLDVPRALFDLLSNPRFRNLVELRLDGQAIDANDLQDILDDAEDARDRNLVPVTVNLDRARLGSVNLELRFVWPLRPVGTAEYTAIPLATPRDAEVLSNTATLTPAGPLRVEPSDDGNWLRDDDLAAASSLQSIGMMSSSRSNMLRLRVARRQEDAGDDVVASVTVVERAWLQSWLSDKHRMDRAVFRFVTGADVIRVQLPEGIEQVIAWVDGREVSSEPTGTQLAVRVPATGSNEHTLEVSLTFPNRPRLGEMRFEAPVLMDAVGPRRWFWQLLVPDNEHLLTTDPKLTSANRWTRVGWLWRRQAAQTQPRLEYWTGASQQPMLPAGLNEYLFSSFDDMSDLQVRTCRRSTLVYSASAIALGLGLALLYWPRLRHPAVLLVLAVGLMVVASLFGDVALLVSQASLVGVLLALLAAFTWLVLQQFGRHVGDPRWMGRPATDSHSGASLPWTDGSAPHSTISAPGPSVPAIAPDSKA